VTLNDDLQAIRAMSKARLDPADWAGLAATIEQLRMLQIAEHSLGVGEVLPDFALPDAAGRVVTSDELLDRGPLVLAFFRGPWCPYCDTTLRALERARPMIEGEGATLVAVSPLRPEALREAALERGLGFTLLSDVAGRLSGLCGIRFEVPEEHADFLRRLRGDLACLHAGAGWQLPLPATYVVDPDAVIRYAFADPDWSRRAEPDELVAAVRQQLQAAPATS
jgi:peroxiredoxin